MSLFRRLSLVFQQKANSALDKAEDPAQALDLSYEKMLENLQKVRQSIAQVLTSEKRLEAQSQTLRAQADKLQNQARQALQLGQQDLARTALARAQVVNGQIEGLAPQIEALRTQEQQLELTGQKLSAKIAAFRAQRDTMKVQYSAAQATTQAAESVTGLSEQMTDVSLMVERAQDKVQAMQARAAAVGELADSGALDSINIGGAGDDIDAQLHQIGDHQAIDAQLEALKRELGTGAPAFASVETRAPGAAAVEGPAPVAIGSGGDHIVVRVIHDEQYRLPASLQPHLDDLDSRLVQSIEAGSPDHLAATLQELVQFIRTQGEQLPHDDLRPSAIIVPSPEMSLDEARQFFESNA